MAESPTSAPPVRVRVPSVRARRLKPALHPPIFPRWWYWLAAAALFVRGQIAYAYDEPDWIGGGLGHLCMVMLCAGLFGPVVRNQLALRPVYAELLKSRHERLHRFLARPGAPQRFPHRVVEAACMELWKAQPGKAMRGELDRTLPTKLIRAVMVGLSAGTLMSVWYTLHGQDLPVVLEKPFEALDARDGRDRQRLLDWEQARGGGKPPANKAPPTDSSARSRVKRPKRATVTGWRRVVLEIRDWSLMVFFLLLLLVALLILCGIVLGVIAFVVAIFVTLLRGPAYIVRELWLGNTLPAYVILVVTACVAAIVFIWRVSVVRRAWLVPGGIIVSRQPFYRRNAKAIYARRMATPLIFSLPLRCAYVRVGNDICKIPFGRPHLLAWIASAPSPSIELVQALVGEETELTIAG